MLGKVSTSVNRPSSPSVIHVIFGVDSADGGTAVSVLELCKHSQSVGCITTLATVRYIPEVAQRWIKSFDADAWLKFLDGSTSLQQWLMSAGEQDGLLAIHSHSLWRMPNLYAARAAAFNAVPHILSPHGSLSTWALSNSALRKKAFLYLGQQRALDTVNCFHATSAVEFEQIRALGFRQPIAVIPLGVTPVEARSSEKQIEEHRLLFFGRIHPVKALDRLLHAWSFIEDRYPKWSLHIVGPDTEGYGKSLEALGRKLSLKRLQFHDPMYGERKNQYLADASITILPSHTENFGLSVAESLSVGTPVIVSDTTPWLEVEDKGVGWVSNNQVELLAQCLDHALSSDARLLVEMGARGRSWISTEFGWPHLAEKMVSVYQWLASNETIPDCVVVE
jgi:glycosyltransferase involved in cell wall biosynthesis